eukprot:CAMPEP_0176131942 /NCGR_PEP_ID=MMETSP0120_2-20121206/66813_1 /TAXON_ID=160619 /ORGANISM="Kryptoperidinium foliaceum, Strain CCMP 1326" /LENGTH=71 /DNA_ID=CAMNT_0017467359 /DNA_START=62 /DNA_END=274 /DNA_ORIENTATION=+
MTRVSSHLPTVASNLSLEAGHSSYHSSSQDDSRHSRDAPNLNASGTLEADMSPDNNGEITPSWRLRDRMKT